MNILKSAILVFYLFLFGQNVLGQSHTQADSIQMWYDGQMGLDQVGLIEGTYFKVYYTKDDSHQFYKEKTWETGTISIEGQVFHTIDLMYELHHDVLLMRHPTDYLYSGQAIQLPTKKIDHFRLHGANFINSQQAKNGVPDGFYQMLYQGSNIQLLVKRKKMKVVGKIIEYTPDDQLFLALDSIHILVKNRRTITNHWPEWKEDIRILAKRNQLRLNRTHEDEWVSLAIYLDELLKNPDKREE